MRVQKIAKTSIYTTKNNSGLTVSFSGNKKGTAQKSMPKISAKLADGANKKPQTIFDEFCSMASGVKRAVTRSYAKSEMHKAIVKPITQSCKNFAKKAPTITKGIKVATVAGVGVGLFEAVKGKISG